MNSEEHARLLEQPTTVAGLARPKGTRQTAH